MRQPSTIDVNVSGTTYREVGTAMVPVRQSRETYVPAQPPAPMVQRGFGPLLPAPTQHEMTTTGPARSQVTVVSSQRDRAIGFNIVTAPLAVLCGVVAMFITMRATTDVLWLLVALFGIMAAVWSGAWFWHELASPDGSNVLAIILHYRLIRHDQKARIERMWHDLEND